MTELHKVFHLDEGVQISWASVEPNWTEQYGTDGLEDLWERVPPEWVCTIGSNLNGGPYFTHFTRHGHLNLLHPCDVGPSEPSFHVLAAAIAQLRCFQYSNRIYFDGLLGRRLQYLDASTIALYKTSPEMRASFPLLEQYLNGSMPKSGYVYLLSDQVGHYKIGHTVDLKRRLAELRTQPPFEIITLAASWVPDRFIEEKKLHQEYSEYRMRGEWFALPGDLAAALASAMAYVEASRLREIKAYNSFDPYAWQAIEEKHRDWVSPETPSFWEIRMQEGEGADE